MGHRRNGQADAPAVDGIVLAAGRSLRMGKPKALLPAGDRAFIERAVQVLRSGGCRDVVVVVGPHAELASALAEASGGRIVVNPDPDAEQIDSLRLGLTQLRADAAAAAVLPVDHPLVSEGTVGSLVRAFAARRAPVVRPTYGGSGGHPTLFSRPLFDELLSGDLAEGARSVIAAHVQEVEDVIVEDAGVVADIDTPDDYAREVGA